MAITELTNAFVNAGATAIGLGQVVMTTADSADPAYLVLTALDRNEYTAGASNATGSFSGNGHTLGLSGIGGDGRGAGIVFTYQATTGRYYSATYGYLDQLTWNSSGRAGDVTNLSLFGTSNLALATADAGNAYSMMQADASGYIGSATVVTRQGFTGPVPAQATPNAIAAVASSFVGAAWNDQGCWLLASTIAAEAGASLPVQSTAVGLPGQANGEWFVRYNGPAAPSGNWQSMVTAGEIVVIGTPGGGGHITTCVSGSGATALLVDNITYVNGSGQIVNGANDGSANDIIVAAPHAASQEWSGVQASSVVIYELDTPVVTDSAASAKVAAGASLALGSLFTAADPVGRAITRWQVYDTATGDSLVLNGTSYQDHTAASALNATSLSAVSLLAGSAAVADTLNVRAYNGSYWGDWTSLAVTVAAAAAKASPPTVTAQTAAQSWLDGKPVSLTLAANTFTDPGHLALTFTASLTNGIALPSWLLFNPATQTFTGTAPATAQGLSIVVTATDSAGLSASETFAIAFIAPPKVAAPTPNQAWAEGKAVSLVLAAKTFTDPQNQKLVYTASLSNGQALPSWLQFNAATQTFSGTAPAAAATLGITVTATDSSGLSALETFTATVKAPPPPPMQIFIQTWADGQAQTVTLPFTTVIGTTGMTFAAYDVGGQNVASWLKCNASTGALSGSVPAGLKGMTEIAVVATAASGLSATDLFEIGFAATLPAHGGGLTFIGTAPVIDLSQMTGIVPLHAS